MKEVTGRAHSTLLDVLAANGWYFVDKKSNCARFNFSIAPKKYVIIVFKLIRSKKSMYLWKTRSKSLLVVEVRDMNCIFKSFKANFQIFLQNVCEATQSYEKFSNEVADRSILDYRNFIVIKKFPWQRAMNTETERLLGSTMWANGQIARNKYEHS